MQPGSVPRWGSFLDRGQIQSAIMRIGYFGGSFDPPHVGHLAAGTAAAGAFSLERVLFAPTGSQPLKAGGAVASFEDRLVMVALLCKSSDNSHAQFEASELDAPHPDGSPNYTIDVLTNLRAGLAPRDQLFVIVGADAFLDVPRWRSPAQLFELAEWIVVSRPNVSRERLLSLDLSPSQWPRVHELEDVHEPASATEVRDRLRLGLDCSDLLTSSVFEYIHSHHLYGS